MKKIPSIYRFLADEDTRDLVSWVFDKNPRALVMPTVKLDGTPCLIRNPQGPEEDDITGTTVYRRYDRIDRRNGVAKPEPPGWVPAIEAPYRSGHWPGWVPITDGPQDLAFREGMGSIPPNILRRVNGTFELVGPKVQGNPYGLSRHLLVPHGIFPVTADLSSHDKLKEFLRTHPALEGIVFQLLVRQEHGLGAVAAAKAKRKDYGNEWPTPEAAQWPLEELLGVSTPNEEEVN